MLLGDNSDPEQNGLVGRAQGPGHRWIEGNRRPNVLAAEIEMLQDQIRRDVASHTHTFLSEPAELSYPTSKRTYLFRVPIVPIESDKLIWVGTPFRGNLLCAYGYGLGSGGIRSGGSRKAALAMGGMI